MLQYHDEIAFPVLESAQEETVKKLNESIIEVNRILKLNVPLGISVDFGKKYSDIH